MGGSFDKVVDQNFSLLIFTGCKLRPPGIGIEATAESRYVMVDL